MPISGDVVDLDAPEGHEAGFRHPAVIVTAQRILDAGPSVVHVVPLMSTVCGYDSDVVVEPSPTDGLTAVSAAQCQHLRSVSTRRVQARRGNVGSAVLAQVREAIALVLDLP